MSQLIADYELNGQGFVIAMFDIDDFKQVNDTYGHVFGDVVLREIASRTVSILRVEDLLFRWGGEEFLLVIRNCDIVRARGVAEKIRRVVSDTPINDGVTSVTVTVTLGLCQFRGGSIDSIIIHADEALYEGKRSGKNMVVVSED
jgi:diguanylate cyclase (GGDEF)-like protein